jgi:hemerythrin-like domain-containing protein
MCEHCGCRGVEPIAELMDEHLTLLDLGGEVRRGLVEGDPARAVAALAELNHLLGHHVEREERGLFTALKRQGDYRDAVLELEDEHTSFDAELAALDADAPDFGDRVDRLLHELSEHIDKENLGIFPVAVVSLGAAGWDIVGRAHAGHAHGEHAHAGHAHAEPARTA